MASTRVRPHLTPPRVDHQHPDTATPAARRPARPPPFRRPGTRATGDAVASNAPIYEWLAPSPTRFSTNPKPPDQEAHTTEVNDHDPATREHRRISLQPTSRNQALSPPTPAASSHDAPGSPAAGPSTCSTNVANPDDSAPQPVASPNIDASATNQAGHQLELEAAVLEHAARRREGGPHTNPG